MQSSQQCLIAKLNIMFEQDTYRTPKHFAWLWVEYKATNCNNYIGSYRIVNKQKLEKHLYTVLQVDDGLGVRIEDYIDPYWPNPCRPLELGGTII